MDQQITARHWAMVVLAAVLLGSSFVFIKIAVETVPPFTIAAARALLAAPLVWAFLRLTGGRLPSTLRGWAPLLVLGLLTSAVPYGAIAWGQQHIAAGLAGILFGTIPVLSVLIAPLFLAEEKFTLSRLAGALIGLAGVAVVIGPEALGGVDNQLIGVLAILLAVVSYTFGAIFARRNPSLPPTSMAAGGMIVGAVLLLPLALLVDRPWTLRPTPEALGAVLFVGVVSTAAAMIVFFWVVRNAGVSMSTLVPLFMPLVPVALGAMFLGEQLPWQAFAGLALILAGAIGVSGRVPRIGARRAEA